MEVLTARYRLGERIWTFRSRHARTLKELEALGLVVLTHAVVENTMRAMLTKEGERLFLYDGYVPPERRVI